MFWNQSWRANCGVTRPGHVKTWSRAGLKPEGAKAKVSLASQPNMPPIESHTITPLSSRPIRSN